MGNQLTDAQIERLTLVAEEAAEVVQAVTKILRHGWTSTHPDHPGWDNRTQLVKEIGDLRAAFTLLVQAKEVHIWEYQKFAVEKLWRVQKYLHCQENISLAQAALDIRH